MSLPAQKPNPLIPPMDPQQLAKLGFGNPFASLQPPTPTGPNTPGGFQAFASDVLNQNKVASAMTPPGSPLHPNAPQGSPVAPQAKPLPGPGIGKAPLPTANAPQFASLQPPSIGGLSSINPPTPKPMASVTPPVSQDQINADQSELQRLQQSGAAVNHIKNPVLRTIAKVGDIAAPFLLGGGAMAVPGTTAHNLWLQKQTRGRVASDLEENQNAADTAYKQAEIGKVLNPPKDYQFVQTDSGLQAADPTTGTASPVLDAQGNPLGKAEKPTVESPQQGYASAITDALNRGIDPMKDPHVLAWKSAIEGLSSNKPDTSAQDDQKYEGIVQKQKLGQKLTPEESAFASAYEKRKTLGQQVTNFYQNQRDEKKGDVATRQATLRAYEPAQDSAERFDVMSQSYEDAIRNPADQQAMLNLLANHLGMTMGLQKGARLNQAIISEAQKSQPLLAGLKAKFGPDGYMTGVTLSPAQMRSMVDLARGRYSGDVKKSRATAQYLGATDDGPKRDPSDATQRYYLSIAGRDPQKARQLMKDDGWTF